jgi:hypothetical protein
MIGVLIERLTMTNSTKLRIMRDKVEIIEEKLAHAEALTGDSTEDTKSELEKDKKAVQKGKGSVIFLIVLGTGLSMLCESFIIHFLFVSWQPLIVAGIAINVGWIASLFLSGLVSYTLIASEMHKRLDSEVIHESLNADNFLATAALANMKDAVSEQMLLQSATKVKEITKSDVITSGIDRAVVKSVDEIMNGGGEIALRIDDEREQKRLQMLHDKERTRQQLSIVRGGNTEPLALADMASFDDSPQPQKSRNYLAIEEVYRKSGEAYFTPRGKSFLARKLGITVKTVERALNQIKEEAASA